MSIETKDEALAFIEAMRLAVHGKPGFRWLDEQIEDLKRFVDEKTVDGF